jgi:dTDP-4-dehydrorhamnose 3,5-epimerase-like enzyme
MIKFIDNYFSTSDERGSFIGLINFGEWKEFNLIKSDSGVFRGGHYHRTTLEGFVILEGEISISIQKVSGGRSIGDKSIYEVKEGDVFIIDPMVYHEFEIKQQSIWINFLSDTMDQSMPDIHNLR